MFNRTHSFTRAVITGGLLSLAVVATDVQAAPQAAAQAQAQTPTSPDGAIKDKVYKAIADDKAISGYAQTLKIIVNDGMVTLKGSVRNDADKKVIGQKADTIAGAANVMNNLVIVADEKPKPQTN